MATAILILMIVLFAITIFPFVGKMIHTDLRHTDLMAGDEGED